MEDNIPNYTGYHVAKDGVVYTRYAKGGRGKLSNEWRPLVFSQEKNGRKAVNLKENSTGVFKRFRVYRLVLTAYVGPCPDGMVACHNDGNVANNNLENLRWDTQKNNLKDTILHGTKLNGTKCHSSKLTNEKILNIFENRDSGMTQESIASKYGVSQSSIRDILLRRDWKHVEIDQHLINSAQAKGRRLSNEQVVEIFKLRSQKTRYCDLIKIFPCSESVIRNILKRKIYVDVNIPEEFLRIDLLSKQAGDCKFSEL